MPSSILSQNSFQCVRGTDRSTYCTSLSVSCTSRAIKRLYVTGGHECAEYAGEHGRQGVCCDLHRTKGAPCCALCAFVLVNSRAWVVRMPPRTASFNPFDDDAVDTTHGMPATRGQVLSHISALFPSAQARLLMRLNPNPHSARLSAVARSWTTPRTRRPSWDSTRMTSSTCPSPTRLHSCFKAQRTECVVCSRIHMLVRTGVFKGAVGSFPSSFVEEEATGRR